MAPLYVTPADRVHEHYVAELVSGMWDCEAVVLGGGLLLSGLTGPVDVGCRDAQGRWRAWLEVKRRRHAPGQYPDVVLAVEKVERALGWASGDPTYFAVRFDTGVWLARLSAAALALPRRTGGRTRDVRRAKDYCEPVVGIPIHWFQPVAEVGRPW